MGSNEVLTHLDLFSGIGGFALAARYLNIQTTDFVEQDLFCQKVLNQNFTDATIYSDVILYQGAIGSHDLITAGFPCQDVSLINSKREGLQGDRSGLFYQATRIIREVQPSGFVLENVPGVFTYLPEILAEIASIGLYECYWFTLRVNQLGGTHRRRRWFLLAFAHPESSYGGTPRGQASQKESISSSFNYPATSSSTRWKSQSRICSSYDGLPSELAKYLLTSEQAIALIQQGKALKDKAEWLPDDKHKLKALGNAVAPQQAYLALKLWQELWAQKNHRG